MSCYYFREHFANTQSDSPSVQLHAITEEELQSVTQPSKPACLDEHQQGYITKHTLFRVCQALIFQQQATTALPAPNQGDKKHQLKEKLSSSLNLPLSLPLLHSPALRNGKI